MKVTITVGECSRELEVRSDLLDAPHADGKQDIAMWRIGSAFVQAYREEVERAKEAASGQPPA